MIEDGTAVGSALATAVNGLEGSDAKTKIVILLTDGQNNAGKVSPLTAAEAAKTLGYRVYTIGAGTRGMARYPRVDLFGNKRLRADAGGHRRGHTAARSRRRPAVATTAPPTPRACARSTRRSTSSRRARTKVCSYLDYHELYPWLVLPALLLLAAEAVLAETWLRVLP